MMALPATIDTGELTGDRRRASALMDDLRVTMEGELDTVRQRCETYLRWYSPPYNVDTGTHDAWPESIAPEDIDTTRANFPIARAVVDLWSSLEAAKPPSVRAEAERVPPPIPVFDPREAAQAAQEYDLSRQMESINSDIRSARLRQWMRNDLFALKHHSAIRRKNLYGFSWMKVMPEPWRRGIRSHVLRDPTTVYPLWSDRDPNTLEAVFSAQRMSARLANARWDLGLNFSPSNPMQVAFERGEDWGRHQEIEKRWFDSERSMVWVEELWWIDRTFDRSGHQTATTVHTATRVLDRIVNLQSWRGWTTLPYVYWENTDERGSYGWSDIAGVIDINDEFNRRISDQADVIRLFASPRFQLLGALEGRDVQMPGKFEMIPLQDQERIEQILTRIDVFPTTAHFDVLTDLLHRVSGLPPIVWGLINNAQTSGRALSASWKATEARLLPKLMRNELSCRQYLEILLSMARHYDWHGARTAFTDRAGDPFDDWTWKFPPMEPRDFTEVTMDAITRRDAGFTTTVRGIRDTGEEDAEEVYEEVQAEFADINAHPDKVNMRLIAEQAQLSNMQLAQQVMAQQQPPALPGGGPPPPGPTAPGEAPAQNAAPPGMEGPLPPTQAGGENAGAPQRTLTSGSLARNGEMSGQLLATQQF